MNISELNFNIVAASKADQLNDILTLLVTANRENLSPIDLNESLSWAAHNGHNDAVRVLLDNGAEVNFQDTQDNTPLHWAAYNGHIDTVKLLINRGANELLMNKNSLTPAKFAQVSASVNPNSNEIIVLIKNMAKEIAQLKTRVSYLEFQLTMARRSNDNTYLTVNSHANTSAQVVKRFGMMKSC